MEGEVWRARGREMEAAIAPERMVAGVAWARSKESGRCQAAVVAVASAAVVTAT